VRDEGVDEFGVACGQLQADEGADAAPVYGGGAVGDRRQQLGEVVGVPADRRRTLVSPAPGEAEEGWREVAATTVDDALAAALHDVDGPELARIIAVLEGLAKRLVTAPGD